VLLHDLLAFVDLFEHEASLTQARKERDNQDPPHAPRIGGASGDPESRFERSSGDVGERSPL
jgi:hypothetical protein